MIFQPVSAAADIKVGVSIVLDEKVEQEPAVLQAVRVLLEGCLEIDPGEFPFFPMLAPFLSICDEEQFVFRSNQVCD